MSRKDRDYRKTIVGLAVPEIGGPRDRQIAEGKQTQAGLVLTRKTGQQILIKTPEGRLIVITAVGAGDGRQRIGVSTGAGFDVARFEIAPTAWQEESRGMWGQEGLPLGTM